MIFTICIEPYHYGRVDYASMSQQTLMEIFVSSTSTAIKFKDHQDNFWDVQHWRGVICNDDGNVTQVTLQHGTGKFDLAWLPKTVESISISGDYEASLDFGCVTAALKHITIGQCPFVRGTLHTKEMPRMLENVSLVKDNLSGLVDFTSLPPDLEVLNLYQNGFDGTVDLTKLPSKLATMGISTNKFTGSIDLEHLPQSLKVLSIGKNRFTGSIALTKLPPQLQCLCVQENCFDGTIRLDQLPDALTDLSFDHNKLNGSFVLRHAPNITTIDAQYNAFDATAIVETVPQWIQFHRSGVKKVLNDEGEEWASDHLVGLPNE